MAPPERAQRRQRDTSWASRPIPHWIGRVVIVRSSPDKPRATRLMTALHHDGYSVEVVPVDRRMIDAVVSASPDIVLICVDDEYDPARLCRDLRPFFTGRIVVAGVRGRLRDEGIVDLLDGGADDYVSAQMSTQLVMARIRVAMRARTPTERPAHVITIGDLAIDLDGHTVAVAGEIAECRPLQFQLLVVLATNVGVTVRPEVLLREVWGLELGTVDTSRLRIAISVLRDVLGEGPSRPVIVSHSKVGYQLIAAAFRPSERRPR